MLKFEKPEYKVAEYIENNFYGKFVLEPLEKGFGTTIGNALRRVMLSNLPGSAVVSVKIDGVLHEFQKIDGVLEDVTEIVLNLKSLVLKKHCEEDKVLHLTSNKEGDVVLAAKKIIEHEVDSIPVVEINEEDTNQIKVIGRLSKTNITKLFLEIADN